MHNEIIRKIWRHSWRAKHARHNATKCFGVFWNNFTEETKMKKTVIVIAGIVCLTAVNVFAVENISFRLKGMHGDLEGLVKDEYTDMMYMPYNILEIDG
ncbi:MAG: hypothetical protein COZ72_00680, partial [Elusimicrobia bacterium CG_4_8_14_3_um_filter_50_9]